MKPHSLDQVQVIDDRTEDEKFRALGPFAARHGRFPKGTVLPETQIIACPRVRMSDLPADFVPPKYYERNLEQNQQLSSCCRHPENHEIEARKSHPDERVPDIYVFYCTCGRKHVRFLVGTIDDVSRPVWKAD